jgi:hypothetical protein
MGLQAPRHTADHPDMQRFYEDEGFDFATLIALGSAYRGLADVGEVLATVERVPNGDRETWVAEWTALADRLRTVAGTAEAAHPVSARTAYLRASLYYDLASSMAQGTADPSRFDSLWEQHRDCWDRAVALWPGVEPVTIPYEDTELDGYWFRPTGAGAEPRPTVVLNNGSDGPVTAMWSQGGAAAVDRGWNAITFDGPGQGAALHRAKLAFRADWEAVITPVVDHVVASPGVDRDRIALHGVSQAGYWVPRAAAFEHRLAAAVADPGVVDVSTSWTSHLPPEMVDLLDDPANQHDFDELMRVGAPPDAYAELQWRMVPYGSDSPFEAYRAARAMRLDAETIGRIACPVLVTDPDDEQFWPGQSQMLFDGLTGPRALVRFTAREGANRHCEVAAQALRDERVFDWLEDVFAGVGA